MGFRVNKCCWMNLRTAGLIIAFLNILIMAFILFFTVHKKSFLRPGRCGDPLWFDAILSVFLLIAIYKNIDSWMWPWLVLRALVLTVIIFEFATYFFSSHSPFSNRLQVIETPLEALIRATFLGVAVWCWIVIYSLYFEIRDEVNKPSPTQVIATETDV